MKLKLTLLLVLLMSILGYAQNTREVRDSLLSRLHLVEGEDKIKLYNNLARKYSSVNIDSAQLFLDKGLALARELNSVVGEAKILNSLGVIAYMRGDFERAESYYHQALTINESLKDTMEIGHIHGNLSNIYMAKGEALRAINSYQKALEIAISQQDSSLIGDVYNNMGQFYNIIDDHQKSMECLLVSIRYLRKVDAEDLFSYYNNLGVILDKMNLQDSALYYYQLALEEANSNGNREGIFYITNNIAQAYLKKNQNEFAWSYIEKTNDLDEMFAGTELAMLKAFIKSSILYNQGKLNEGLKLAREAYQESKEKNMTQQLFKLSKLLSNIYLAKNDYKNAHDYLLVAYNLSDSITGQDKHEQAMKLELKYQYDQQVALQEQEQKMKEGQHKLELQSLSLRSNIYIGLSFVLVIILGLLIITLFIRWKNHKALLEKNNFIHKQNEEIQLRSDELLKTSKELEQLNQFKNRLLAVLAHDIKTPLNSLHSLLDLVEATDLSEPDVFKQISGKISSQLLLLTQSLDNLLRWTKLQMVGEYVAETDTATLNEIISEVVDLYQPLMLDKNIEVNIDLNGLTNELISNTGMMRLIMRNFISNAVKYSDVNAKINIKATKSEDGTYRLEVQDFGKGMSIETQNLLFASPMNSERGTSKEIGAGLGLLLCKEFVEKVNGQIGVISELGRGSTFYVQLKN